MKILMVGKIWRYNLEHDEFIIKNGHESLKYILEQKIYIVK
jgi:hypothetical protein